MFTGRPHRSVNLGSKKSSSAHDALRNAELQRQKREKLRREVNAATKLQTAWRARRDFRQARHELAQLVDQNPPLWLAQPNVYAYILPDLPNWPPSTQQRWTAEFIALPESANPSPLLLQRLPLLWEARSQAGSTDWPARLGLQLLSRQAPPTIAPELMIPLLNSIVGVARPQGGGDPREGGASIDSATDGTGVPSEFAWLSQRYPAAVFAALIRLPQAEQVLERLPAAAFVPFYTISALDLSPTSGPIMPLTPMVPLIPFIEEIRTVLAKILLDSLRSWPLVFKLVDYVGAMRSLPESVVAGPDFPQFFSRGIVETAIAADPLGLAQYTQTLFRVAPSAKPRVLLQMATATPKDLPATISRSAAPPGLASRPAKIYWDIYQQSQSELALCMTVELISYWLLVATDYELVSSNTLGLDADDLREFASVVKEHSFKILWVAPLESGSGRRRVATASETAMLRLLRQFYTRDSRMKLFPPNFWLVDASAGQKFVQIFDSYLKGNRPKSLSFNLATDDVHTGDDDDDDDIFDENGEPRADAGEMLRLDENPAKRTLDYAPFFIPFETRVMLFSRFVAQDRERLEVNGRMFSRQHFDINRETIVEDSQHVFASLGSNVKTEMAVRLSSDGHPEAGIDGGGLTRELLIALCEKLFHDEPTTAAMPLFVETPQHTLIPNPVFGESPELMTPQIRAKYLFMGQVIGKCLYENLLIDVEFAPLFLSKWRGGALLRSSFDSLALLDEELYSNLTKLHSIYGKDVEALGLDFTTVNSQRHVVELRPGGASVPVTDMNKFKYMRELSNYKLNTVFKPQSAWFLLGLSQIIRLEWLSLFNPQELNKLISGESLGMDVDDLMRHASITGFAHDSSTINNLWSILREFTAEERAQFLKFVISVPKPPLLGFSRLEPGFGIRYVGHDDQRLPTASTCVNLLKLPEYSSKEVLREKLLYSIRSKAGFELS